ncbi:acyltransferase family protein [Nocardioides sp. B-3]|uniref:acyltransferase family protein n=1 Tax=Nocardioides sp. B-3 TaxID=2895565 RepID=UPI002153753B|nr:acyltransferase [Nocardioides sp. B-3]UUZ58851.1 acyltransferase [Nocardioides sp. B-3]
MDVGVAIFFVLSGFLLSRAYWARAELEAPSPNLTNYALKRVRRIMPVYVITVAAALLLVPDNEGSTIGAWLVSLTLTDTYVHATLPYGLTHMWSLGAEVAFYALLPFLMWVMIGRHRPSPRRAGFGPVMMVVINISWIAWVVPTISNVTSWAPNLWLPGYVSWFAAGMWLAPVHVRDRDGTFMRVGSGLVQLGRQPGVCWVAAGGLMLVASTPVAGPVSLEVGSVSEALLKNPVYAAIGFLPVAAGVWAPPGGGYMRLMGARLVRHLGHISYSIFCVHLIVLGLVRERLDYQLFTGDFPRIWALTAGCTIIVSELLYWLVERPLLRRSPLGRTTIATQTPTADMASTAR